MEEAEFVVVGCGPAGGTAAREASRAGIGTVVLEKDAVVGAKRVCAAGLRPGFCEEFDLPRSVIHCDTPRFALFDLSGYEHAFEFGPGHTSTREELDGEIGRLAVHEGADVRTGMLFRGLRRDGDRTIVEYADMQGGERRLISARNVFLAQGATAKLDSDPDYGFEKWQDGLLTTLQYRVFTDTPVDPIAYKTLELHYYLAQDGRLIVAWMFPKRDHLAVGLGVRGKMPGAMLRDELNRFEQRVRARLYPGANVTVKQEGHLLYGGWPRPRVSADGSMLGGTAAGLVDATNGEGIFEAAMSGRYAAEAVATLRNDPSAAPARYAKALQGRFHARLSRRVQLMHFLEKKPSRFAILFEQLAASPAFANAILHERHERSMAERFAMATQGLKLMTRSAFAQ